MPNKPTPEREVLLALTRAEHRKLRRAAALPRVEPRHLARVAATHTAGEILQLEHELTAAWRRTILDRFPE